MSSSNLVILLHALNIQFSLISLDIRIELLRTVIRGTASMQRKASKACSNSSKAALLARLETSKLIYEEIINISSMINGVFGWSILIVIFHYSMELILGSYWVCYLILHEISLFGFRSVLPLLTPSTVLLEFAIIASRIANVVCSSAFTFRPFLHPFFFLLGKYNSHGH